MLNVLIRILKNDQKMKAICQIYRDTLWFLDIIFRIKLRPPTFKNENSTMWIVVILYYSLQATVHDNRHLDYERFFFRLSKSPIRDMMIKYYYTI